ncbi:MULTISPECIES: DUF4375 domain-containing protein [Pseudomonas]|nr:MULTISPECIES: DUF4375 domain-containing protein [Pseudomonas]MCW2290266.1 hypothetical protein [Pseudomonas sp. BIGb0408]NYH75161.1 hypothetical protein [Pseudomonas flavescens]
MPYHRYPELAFLKIDHLSFDEQKVFFHLRNGQVFSLIQDGYLRLDRLSPAQRQDYRLENLGFTASWRHLGGSCWDAPELAWEDLQNQALRRLDEAAWDLEAIELRDRQLVALWRLQADYYNGGLLQFFANWGMPTFEYAQAALALLGLQQARQLLQDFYGVFAHLQDEPTEIALWDIPQWLTEAQNARLCEVDERLGEAIEELQWVALGHFLTT